MEPVTWIAIIEALFIWWGTYEYSEVKEQRDQLAAVVEECAESRKEQTERKWRAADDRSKQENTLERIIVPSELDSGSDSQVGNRIVCPGLGERLGRTADREALRSKRLNDHWMRSGPESHSSSEDP